MGGRAVNPADHLSTRRGGPYTARALSARASAKVEERVMSDGKCWINYEWVECMGSRR
jgi:hypothetical protein